MILARALTWVAAPAGWWAGSTLTAQVSGASDLTGLATVVTQLGISAVFIWLYAQERRERQESQRSLAAFVERHGAVLKDAVEALEGVQHGMAVQVERASASPLRNDLDLTLRRLELAADELSVQARRRRRGDPDGEP